MNNWFPDDQHGFSVAVCDCPEGPYIGARKSGTPCCCERCGFMTREQFEFLVDHISSAKITQLQSLIKGLMQQAEGSQMGEQALALRLENVRAKSREAMEKTLETIHYKGGVCDCSACTDGLTAEDVAYHLSNTVVEIADGKYD